VYSGLAREFSEATKAVNETEGEVLVNSDGRIVGAVYSSNCGGHTEDNDMVWEQEADPSLRGKPDVPDDSRLAVKWRGPLNGEKLKEWLEAKPDSWCKRSSYANPGAFRWKKVIKAAEMNALVNKKYKIGRVTDVKVIGRGVSGRVTGVKITGGKGSAHVGREFAVRQIFDGLKSGMFTLDIKRNARGEPVKFVFTGGGWGHGVGMCQTGAIGMAEAGLDYRRILMHYFSGSQLTKVY
jgi:SpoIID/LytB domain protein